ncbi:MAG: hypothetical protein ACQET8_18280 [Bacillota bacterium]
MQVDWSGRLPACHMRSFLQGMRRGSSLRQHRLVDAGAERQPLSGQVETPKGAKRQSEEWK